MAWQQATASGRRNLLGATIDRHKHLIGRRFLARTLPGQQGEAAIVVAVLDRMIRTGARPPGLNVMTR